MVAGIRTVRKQKQIKQHEPLSLEIKGAHDDSLDAVLVKMGNLSSVSIVEEKNPAAASFIVGAVGVQCASQGQNQCGGGDGQTQERPGLLHRIPLQE